MLKVKTGRKSLSFVIDRYRIFIILGLLLAFSILFAPNFFNLFNLTTIMKSSSLYVLLAIGMTIVMICGQLDLSIQSVMNLGAVLVIGLYAWSKIGWILSIVLALAAGAVIGLINGLIVTKGKIHSFIVTLGTMTITTGLIYLYTHGGSISTEGDFALADWMENPLFPLFPPRVLITVLLVIVFSVLLNKTRFGRAFYMVGGNPETAWLAGINTDRQVIAAFTFSGVLSALSGALFAISISSAVPNMGSKGVSPLMVVIAAVIIGGTSMSGGKGGVLKSFTAVVTVMVLFNALNCFQLGYEVQVFANGLVLALVVLYEALAVYRQEKQKGIRLKLMAEAMALKSKFK